MNISAQSVPIIVIKKCRKNFQNCSEMEKKCDDIFNRAGPEQFEIWKVNLEWIYSMQIDDANMRTLENL